MMDPQSLYRDVVACEGALRELQRSQPSGSPNALYQRMSLMEKSEILVSSFPGFAATKEIEQGLWKPCFYKRIEDFRRRIRKYASQSGNDRTIRDHFFKLSSEFQAFLDEAAAFYERLHGYFASDTISFEKEALRHSMFRCLIFLGDIARYRELHSQKTKKNFITAEGFYHRALNIMPENGNPHNQLAVLATYIEAETIAVYRYCRSLLLPQPFATAQENLALLFERSRHRPLAPSPIASISTSSPPKEKSAFLKTFLHRLTRLHGIFYAPKPDEVYPTELEQAICSDFDALLKAGVLGDALVLKLFVINIFCITRASSMQTHAIDLTLALMNITMKCITEKLALLGPISVLCDFFRRHFDLLENVSSLDPWLDTFAAVLNEHCHSGHVAPETELTAMKPRLKESIELRCFEPLGDLVPGPGGSLDSVPETEATRLRCANLLVFAGLLQQQNHLNEYHGRYYTTPLQLHDTQQKHTSIDDDEEEFDDEVIVFQPLDAPLHRTIEATNAADSPSFGGADLSAFRHLGGGIRPLGEEISWGPSPSMTWTQQRPTTLDTSNPWNDLAAVEAESNRFEHQVSSLSVLIEENQRGTTKPPPGFSNIITRNPFVIGNT